MVGDQDPWGGRRGDGSAIGCLYIREEVQTGIPTPAAPGILVTHHMIQPLGFPGKSGFPPGWSEKAFKPDFTPQSRIFPTREPSESLCFGILRRMVVPKQISVRIPREPPRDPNWEPYGFLGIPSVAESRNRFLGLRDPPRRPEDALDTLKLLIFLRPL